MAVTVLDKGKVRGTGSLAVTGVTAGSTLVVFAYTYDDDNYTIDDDAGTMVREVTYWNYTGLETYYVTVWVLKNAAAGTHNITLGAATSANSMRWCVEVTAADTSDSFDTSANNYDTGSSCAVGAISNAVADTALIAFVTGQGSANYSGLSGWTLFAQSNDATYGRNARVGYLVLSSTTSTSSSWSSDASYRILSTVVAISGAAGGGGGGARRISSGIVS